LPGGERECAQLDGLVQVVATGGAGLLRLSGDPGVGKTALLEHAAAVAAGRGVTVVRLAGVAAESALPVAGVQRLLMALGVSTAELPAAQGQALDVAFGRSVGPAPDRFRIGTVHYEGCSHFRQGRAEVERAFAAAPADLRERVRWLEPGTAADL
jgi:hypothetical protein